MRGHRDLEIAAGASALCALLALFFPLEVVRVLAALPLCFALPGYALTAALQGRRLDPWRNTVMSLGMSLAILAVGGLLLNFVGGIYPGTWAALLVLLVIGCCRAAALRRGQPAERRPLRPSLGLGTAGVLTLAAAAVIAAVAIVVAETPFPADEARGFSRLWMLPAETRGEVRVGVASEEHHTFDYTLEFRVGGQQKANKIGFRLDPGEEREFTLPVGRAAERGPVRVKASLIREDRFQEVYRRVTTWLPASGTKAR